MISASLLLIIPIFSFLLPTTCLSGCDASCLSCLGPNPDQCLSCRSSMLASGGRCICPDGQYATSGFTSCASCSSACGTCTGGSASDCSTCPTGSFIYNSVCYTNCGSTQYFNSLAKSCQSCDPTCLTCSDSTSTTCTSCSSGTLINGACKCHSGEFRNASYICQSCSSTCKECSGASSNQCTACATGLILQNGECICTTGSYLNTSPLSCLACDSNCKGCTGPSSNQCTSCKNNMILNSSTGKCICPSNTFFDSALISCQTCSSHCQECSGALSTQCTSCKNNLVLLLSGECGCPAGKYLDSTAILCVDCDSSCKTCSEPTSSGCTDCDPTFVLVSGQCKCSTGCSCPSGTYFEPISLACRTCDISCTECSGPASNQCTHCDSSEILVNGKCVCSGSNCNCPTGSFFDSGTLECESCSSKCLACNGAGSSQCSSCKNNLVLVEGECTCSAATYLHPTLNTCISCDSSCATCTGASDNECSSCKNNMQLLSSSSKCGCGSGTYADLGTFQCLSCDSSCKECTGPEKSQCTNCLSIKLLQDNYCLDICGSHTYRSGDKSCQTCDDSCVECKGPDADQCSSCATPAELIGGQCKITGCHSSCSTCQGPSETQCFMCKDGLVFLEENANIGRCLQQCPSSTYVTSERGEKTCKAKGEIDNRLAYGSGLSEVNILFGTNIHSYYDLLMANIDISIAFIDSQPPLEYSLSKRLSDDQNSIIIAFTFSSHLLSGNMLDIKYNTFKKDNTTDFYLLNAEHSMRMFKYYKYSESVQKAITATSTTNVVASQTNSIFSWITALGLRSIHSMRSQIVEDMISKMIFINSDFPPNFAQFANDSQSSLEAMLPNFGVPLLNSLRSQEQSSMLDSQGSAHDVNDSLNKYAPNRNFLSNFGSTIGIFGLSFFAVLVVELLRSYSKRNKEDKRPFIRRLLYNISTAVSYSLRWNFIVNQFISAYIRMLFFSLREVTNVRPLTGAADYLQYIFGVLGLTISLVGLIYLIWLINKIYKVVKRKNYTSSTVITLTLKEEDFLKRVEILHSAFFGNKRARLLYPFLLILRSAGFILALIFLQDQPVIQLFYPFVTTILMLVYLFYYKPLQAKSQQILTIIYEIILFVATVAALAIHFYSKENMSDISTRSSLGFFLCGCSLSISLLNFAAIAMELGKFRKFFRSKQKVSPFVAVTASEDKSMNIFIESPSNFTKEVVVPQIPIKNSQNFSFSNLSSARKPRNEPENVENIDLGIINRDSEGVNGEFSTNRSLTDLNSSQGRITNEILNNLDSKIALYRKATLTPKKSIHYEVEENKSSTYNARNLLRIRNISGLNNISGINTPEGSERESDESPIVSQSTRKKALENMSKQLQKNKSNNLYKKTILRPFASTKNLRLSVAEERKNVSFRFQQHNQEPDSLSERDDTSPDKEYFRKVREIGEGSDFEKDIKGKLCIERLLLSVNESSVIQIPTLSSIQSPAAASGKFFADT